MIENITPDSETPCILCLSQNTELWAESWDVEFHTSDERYHYYRCKDCGVLFIDPVPVERLHLIYPPNYNNNLIQDSFVNKIKIWLDGVTLKKTLGAIPGSELSALDIGGGYGLQLDIIRNLDPRVTFTQVVDIDRLACESASKKGHSAFCGKIEEFHTDRKFDFITMYNLIEHVAEPIRILEAAQSMLSPGGLILLKTPNHDSLDARIFRHRNWSGYHCPRHWVIFTKESLERTVTNVGLRVKSFSYTQGAPFWTQSVLTYLSDKGLIRINPDNPTNTHALFPLLSAGFAAFDFLRRLFSKTSQMVFVLSK